MDLATLIGLIGGFGIVIGAIVTGGSAGVFVNAPSMLVVLGGTVGAIFIQFPLGNVFGAVGVAMKAFMFKIAAPAELIQKSVELATIVRKEGLLSLENQEVEDPFFQKGIGLCVDGHSPEFVRKVLTQDMQLTIERHEKGRSIWKAMGDTAPAMGMIGTLIGLVQMLSNMDDPKAIGPSMAVALLTTLYGALIANLVALPIANKLALRSDEEKLNKSLIIETIHSIQEGENPRVMEQSLRNFLPSKKRDEESGSAE